MYFLLPPDSVRSGDVQAFLAACDADPASTRGSSCFFQSAFALLFCSRLSLYSGLEISSDIQTQGAAFNHKPSRRGRRRQTADELLLPLLPLSSVSAVAGRTLLKC